MKDTVKMNLDLDHIDEDLIDLECEVELELYEGTNDSDDPSEFEVLSVKCIDEACPALFGQFINGIDHLEEYIIKKYQRLNK